jgi:hypothetical protein
MQQVDENMSGSIDFSEFLKVIENQKEVRHGTAIGAYVGRTPPTHTLMHVRMLHGDTHAQTFRAGSSRVEHPSRSPVLSKLACLSDRRVIKG